MNPYDILGVSENATDEEINKAYKRLAKKYHPDINPSEEAAKKMVEINCAYDEIKKLRERHQTYQQYKQSTSNFYDNDNVYRDAYSNKSFQDRLYAQVEAALRAGAYFEAYLLLQSNPIHEGKWYYYNAYIYAKTGSFNQAYQFILVALELEPNNHIYQDLKKQLDDYAGAQSSAKRYKRKTDGFETLIKIISWIIILIALISCVSHLL